MIRYAPDFEPPFSTRGKLFGFQKSAQRPPSRPRQTFLLIKKNIKKEKHLG
jgi:hypothetical protein